MKVFVQSSKNNYPHNYNFFNAYEGFYCNEIVQFDSSVIEKCIKDFISAPAGCTVDFGVTNDGRTLLIEVNDGYAIGCCSLNKYSYAKLLSARWAELTHTENQYNFESE